MNTEKMEEAWQKVAESEMYDLAPTDKQIGLEQGFKLGYSAANEWREKPIDAVLWCPNCGEQHIDEAKPDICELCGHADEDHPNGGECGCNCEGFTAWMNPPHKSHRCNFCNHVWRPAEGPTNGVIQLSKQGERDESPKPRYFATKKDFDDAVASVTSADAEKLRECVNCGKAAFEISPLNDAEGFCWPPNGNY